MRESKWVNAQLALVGHIECRSPDPLNILNVGNRYETNHRAVRAARRSLTRREQDAITDYLTREDELVRHQDEEGNWHWRAIAPPMRDEEAAAFRHLWRVLADSGSLTRFAPRPKPTDPAPATE